MKKRLLLFTMPNCGQCDIAKKKLEDNKIPYTEVPVMENKKNIDLANKYNIKMAGTIIDTETGFTIEL
jgi:glutaredoxin-related protein